MLADDMTAKTPTLFHTYDSPEYRTPNCTIWEAARATTATPNIFEDISIGPTGCAPRYIEAGMGCNNPITQLRQEARLIFPDQQVACIVSIGCGQASIISIPKRGPFERLVIPDNVIKAAKLMASDCEEKHQDAARFFGLNRDIYFRFNADNGLEEVGSEEWKTLPKVAAHAHQYLRMHDQGERLKLVTQALQDRPDKVSTSDICALPFRCSALAYRYSVLQILQYSQSHRN